MELKSKCEDQDKQLEEINNKFNDLKQFSEDQKLQTEQMFETFVNETIVNVTKPQLDSISSRLEDQKHYFDNLIEPISTQVQRLDVID